MEQATPAQPTLTDGAVTLRPWRPTDAQAVYEACQDPEIPRFVPIPQPYSLDDGRWFVTHAAEESATGPSAHFAIVDPALAYVQPAKALAAMAVDLLADGAAGAREVLAGARPPMTRQGYLDFQRGIARRELYDGGEPT